MGEQAMVSVIIPVYNVEQYLRECVDSVLHQTYQNFEIILVDDGSKDSSPAICDEYAMLDKRIRVIHQNNSGLSVARNTGLHHVLGSYIYFLDSDDLIEENAFELLLEKITETGADFVFFDAFSFKEEKTPCTKQNYRRPIHYQHSNGLSVLKMLQENRDFHAAVPLLFFKTDFLIDNQLSFEQGIVYEDMIFTYQAFCVAKCVAHVNSPLYLRRYRSGSITSVKKSKHNFVSCGVVYKKVSKFTRDRGLACETTDRYIAKCAFNALNTFEQIGKKEQLECKKIYTELQKDILAHRSYHSKALWARCYGKLLWAVVRALEKIGII